MADVQLEHGFTRIADALLEALARVDLTGREFRLVHAIVRITYGYGKAADRIGATQLAAATGIDRRNVQKVLASLERRNVVAIRRHGDRKRHAVSIVKDFERWDQPSQTAVVQDAVPQLPSAVVQDAVTVASAVVQDADLPSYRMHSIDKRHKKKKRERPKRLPRDKQLTADPGLVASLAALETKRGIRHSEADAAAWLAWVAPDLIAYRQKSGKPYTDLPAAARNWWRRVKPEEIETARVAQENRAFQARFGARIAADAASPEPIPVASDGWGVFNA